MKVVLVASVVVVMAVVVVLFLVVVGAAAGYNNTRSRVWPCQSVLLLAVRQEKNSGGERRSHWEKRARGREVKASKMTCSTVSKSEAAWTKQPERTFQPIAGETNGLLSAYEYNTAPLLRSRQHEDAVGKANDSRKKAHVHVNSRRASVYH